MATPGERKKRHKKSLGKSSRGSDENSISTTTIYERRAFLLKKANEATAKSGYRRDRKSSYHDPIYVRQYNASRRECSKSYNYHEQDHKS